VSRTHDQHVESLQANPAWQYIAASLAGTREDIVDELCHDETMRDPLRIATAQTHLRLIEDILNMPEQYKETHNA
jgi:hypothetical protein